jgi:hypothetical protein
MYREPENLMVLFKRILIVAALSASLPVALAAQQRAPATAATSGAASEQQVQQWIAELQELHGKLGQIQERAMEDAALRDEQAALGNDIRSAMEKADPGLAGLMARMQELETQAAGAQQAGDEAALQRLAQEAQGIQTRFAQAQHRAFEEPAIAARVQSFQTKLETRMAQIDPQAPGMVQRFQQLEERLNTAMQTAGRRP